MKLSLQQRLLFYNIPEDFQSFAINLPYVQTVFGYFFADKVDGAPFEQTITDLRNIRVQYLRILLSSFGEENFKNFALNLLC